MTPRKFAVTALNISRLVGAEELALEDSMREPHSVMKCINVELTELKTIYLFVFKKLQGVQRRFMCGITQTIVCKHEYPCTEGRVPIQG